MTLYSQLGSAMDINAEQWEEVLRIAVDNGWQPKGTHTPPVSFDTAADAPWNRDDYLSASGQIVGRKDAATLGLAVKKAFGRFRNLTETEADRLVDFCLAGPFIISTPFGMDRQVLALDAALRSAGTGPAVVEPVSPHSHTDRADENHPNPTEARRFF